MEIRKSDRRQENIPVDTDRRSGVDRREQQKQGHSSVFYALETVPTFRRTLSISDNLESGNTATAIGMAGLAAINLPEDIRDVKGALKQLKGAAPKYDYKLCQHPFSFFKGTFLERFVNPVVAKDKELASKLLSTDKTLAESRFGLKVLEKLQVKSLDGIQTKIETIGSTKEQPKYVFARIYEGGSFGKLTARAMERTTVWGLFALTLLELPKIFKAYKKQDPTSKQALDTSNQIIKSALNVSIMAAGIGYIGALGAQKFGHCGSLIGIAAGAILGNKVSSKAQELIS